MEIKAIQTHRILPNESLFELLDVYVQPVEEEEIVVITSKIVSLCEGRVVPKKHSDKQNLVYAESEAYLPGSGTCLTIKNRILIPAAGIDESNVQDAYVLYPKDIPKSACQIWEHLRKKRKVQKVGILITDSHTTIGRRGVIGIGIGWCGFKPLHNYIGKEDCFGRPLKITMANHLDALAVAAVHIMGEGAERTPFAKIRNASKIEFQDRPPSDEELQSIYISPEEDLYGALFEHPSWVWKSNNIT